MRLLALSAIVVVLGVATGAGVGFAGCGGGGGSSASLVWLDPSGAGTPPAHTQIRCSESGANTAELGLAAANLGPGDGCVFNANLHNTGNQELRISEQTQESTARGDPSFTSCFSFVLSAGPHSGELGPDASYGYSFTLQLLSTASHACQTSTGTVVATFTGSET